MSRTRKQKAEMIETYTERVKQSSGFIVMKPKALTPNEVNSFRKNIFDFGASFSQVKNTLFKKALENLDIKGLDLDSGEYAILFLQEDFISPSKTLKKFIDEAKDAEGELRLELVAGYLDNAVLTKSQVAELSEVPDKRGSVSMILGILDQSIAGILNVLEDAPRAYVSVIDQAFKE